MDSNFEFLNRYWPLLYQLGSFAETYYYSDPNSCMNKLGQFGEALTGQIMKDSGLYLPYKENTQFNRLNLLRKEDLIPEEISEKLHLLRIDRNKAEHKFKNEFESAKTFLPLVHDVACWYMEVYGDYSFIAPAFVEPQKEVKVDWHALMDAKRKALADKQAELDESQEALKTSRDELAKSREALKAQQDDLAKSKAALENSETALEDAQSSLQKKEQEIEAQKRAIEQKEKQIQQQEDNYKSIKSQIEEQQLELEKKDLELMDQKALLEEKEKLIEQLLSQIKAVQTATSGSGKEERKKKAKAAAAKLGLTEAETRMLIDAQLQEAGWEADTVNLRYSKGARPQAGKNLAIAEWPISSDSGTDHVDYALFVGERMLAVVEAKRDTKDVSAYLDNQCRKYASHIREEDRIYCVGEWNGFQVPFLFATNGRPYLKQLETKSGIWFRDSRKESNLGKALQGWYSPQGLEDVLNTDIDQLNQGLIDGPKDFLEDENGLALRDYQIRAVEAVEKALIEGKRSMLVAMATGTGKTRTVLGMIYRFLATKRFHRILFLVDRNALGTQAQDTFKEVKLENLQTLDEIYNIKEIGEGTFDPETKVHVSTVHSIIRRLASDDETEKKLTVSDYDLIIIDEAHRGYTLDKEMSDDELQYRNQEDFVSRFRQAVEFFDAVKIALTATPALHTSQIFGEPVFTYSYREAVIDGWLVDHDPPHIIGTEKSEGGIHFKAGDKVPVYNQVTGELMNGFELADDLDFDVEKFNRKVITPSYNRVVLEEICNNIDPFGKEKTLIFAVDDAHADMIVDIIRKIYEPYGLPQKAVRKITGSIGDRKTIEEAIKEFKNEDYPSVVVTVDLLTTGIDVPRICNLVFLRQVRSRILFEQMMGRATRRCDEIKKTHFEIYDAAHMFENLEDVTNMKAVCPTTTLEDLLNELETVTDDEKVENTIDKIVAKLQRKNRNVSEDGAEKFSYLTGESIKDFANRLKDMPPQEAKELLLGDKEADAMRHLDADYVYHSNVKVIDEGDDRLVSHTRGYGDGEKPEDYLESFGDYIRNNLNEIEALRILCTRPSDLTSKELKKLQMELDMNKFSESQLRSAWREVKNEDIAADIIAFIRQQALGSSLMSHEDRVRKAFDRLRKAHSFNMIQKGWLEKIEATMLQTPVLEHTILNEGQYRQDGGFDRIDQKFFGGDLKEYLDELNEYLYEDGGKQAL